MLKIRKWRGKVKFMMSYFLIVGIKIVLSGFFLLQVLSRRHDGLGLPSFYRSNKYKVQMLFLCLTYLSLNTCAGLYIPV